jgi:hypothetical protein
LRVEALNIFYSIQLPVLYSLYKKLLPDLQMLWTMSETSVFKRFAGATPHVYLFSNVYDDIPEGLFGMVCLGDYRFWLGSQTLPAKG